MITTSRPAAGAPSLPAAPAVIFAHLGLIDIALLGVVGPAIALPLTAAPGSPRSGLSPWRSSRAVAAAGLMAKIADPGAARIGRGLMWPSGPAEPLEVA